ncbi:MAG: Gfo/Idh/MocA family oxidoreductase [Fimbriimonadaceae bacterium]|nr:Gfo/Idh/MocA family oxidoreductase [Fimbriimonadaceae bacterium]
MFRCAILGCGPRAKGHARAYAAVPRGQLVGICDTNATRLAAFGDEFGIAARYLDAAEMIQAVRPDVLHIVTLPQIRREVLQLAHDLAVPAVIIEKPIALWGEDWTDLQRLAATTELKVAVNTQLHFHAQNLALQQLVADGGIGELRLIDASARSTPLDQGVHVLELADNFNGYAGFAKVFGQVSGAGELAGRQPSPDRCCGLLEFANEVRLQLTCGDAAPYATDRRDVRWHHKRCAVYGTAGFVHWTMESWEQRTVAGGYQSGNHDYGVEDQAAQARLTEALFDWLLDETCPHPTRLERSLAEFNALLGLYQSALEHRPVELPCEPAAGLAAALATRLA